MDPCVVDIYSVITLQIVLDLELIQICQSSWNLVMALAAAQMVKVMYLAEPVYQVVCDDIHVIPVPNSFVAVHEISRTLSVGECLCTDGLSSQEVKVRCLSAACIYVGYVRCTPVMPDGKSVIHCHQPIFVISSCDWRALSTAGFCPCVCVWVCVRQSPPLRKKRSKDVIIIVILLKGRSLTRSLLWMVLVHGLWGLEQRHHQHLWTWHPLLPLVTPLKAIPLKIQKPALTKQSAHSLVIGL